MFQSKGNVLLTSSNILPENIATGETIYQTHQRGGGGGDVGLDGLHSDNSCVA